MDGNLGRHAIVVSCSLEQDRTSLVQPYIPDWDQEDGPRNRHFGIVFRLPLQAGQSPQNHAAMPLLKAGSRAVGRPECGEQEQVSLPSHRGDLTRAVCSSSLAVEDRLDGPSGSSEVPLMRLRDPSEFAMTRRGPGSIEVVEECFRLASSGLVSPTENYGGIGQLLLFLAKIASLRNALQNQLQLRKLRNQRNLRPLFDFCCWRLRNRRPTGNKMETKPKQIQL